MAQKSIEESLDDLDDDLLPAPAALEQPKAKTTRAKSKKPAAASSEDDELPEPRSRRRARPAPAELDPLDEEMPEREPIPFTNDEVTRVEQIMKRRLTKAPVFPHPEELSDKLKPYWTELVNSFPDDHFTAGDIVAMKLYCRCAHDIERCNALIEQEGDVIHGPRGPMVNPRVKVRSVSETVLLGILTKFRNQPASRANSENFQTRQGKKNAEQAADDLVESDDDGLLGGRASMEKRAMSRGDSYVN